METHMDPHDLRYLIYDTRVFPEKDAIYKAAVDLTDEIMRAVDRLSHSHTIETASLFITDSGAQLILLTRSFERDPIDRMFGSSIKRVTYDPSSGYLQTYVIPILEACSSKESSNITADL
jgi:hypothetical protein